MRKRQRKEQEERKDISAGFRKGNIYRKMSQICMGHSGIYNIYIYIHTYIHMFCVCVERETYSKSAV